MDASKLIMINEHNELNLLNLLEWEDEFEQTIEDFRLSYGSRQKKHKAPPKWAQMLFKQPNATFWEKDVPGSSDAVFKQTFRMERKTFQLLVKRLQGMKKKRTSCRTAIPIDKRIAIALYALGSTADNSVVSERFGVCTSTVYQILNEFCTEVQQVLALKHLPKKFLTQKQLEACVRGFEAKGFPQCFGAIGCHHLQVCPALEDYVEYSNNQSGYTKILFALVDYRCRFLYVSYDCPGRYQNAEVYEQSSLKQIINATPLFKSNSKSIEGVEVPVVLLGDATFGLSTQLMTPYADDAKSNDKQQEMFNEAHDKAKQVVEQAFQQLEARFPRITKGLDNPSKPSNILISCCILHNFLISNNSQILEESNSK